MTRVSDVIADLTDAASQLPRSAGAGRFALVLARVCARHRVPIDAQTAHVLHVLDAIPKSQRVETLLFLAQARLIVDTNEFEPLPCPALLRVAKSLGGSAPAGRYALAVVQTLGRVHERVLAAEIALAGFTRGARQGRFFVGGMHYAGIFAFASDTDLIVGDGVPLVRKTYAALRANPAATVAELTQTLQSTRGNVQRALDYLVRVDAIKRIPSLQDRRALHTIFNPHFKEVCRGSD